ncbi:IclR family transcriptional regulator domain-containing protein [Noviherbaspirillum denitrificans]|uniref:IclR family transcriptional regulator n=1 Tax=Noviherbaspirillum denitrificans TaxID=1968433 RepID=A0A254TIQ0_9BURK|nr:IclR family transcriptional regulator C-terminal domain-containing protein [Noviherbaspirillum denitrificans]OWW22506.1 IclR family transcriptional regulator [Noviherbaspirillum denitrificans]
MTAVKAKVKASDTDALSSSSDVSESLPTPGDGYVQSFARGLAVLRSFGSDAPSQTLSEVAERTGLTRAGARRILLTLLHLDYVEADGRQFKLTPKVLELGFAYLSSLPVWTRAQPIMEDLVESLRQSCSAAVLDGDEIVYVLRVPAHKIMSINLGIGSRLPAYCTSMGRVLLSGLPTDVLHARLSAMERKAYTANTLTDVDDLMSAIALVKKQGWAMVEQELEMGLTSIAAPVIDRAGRIVAAVNISGQATPQARDALIEKGLPQLLEAVGKINRLVCT